MENITNYKLNVTEFPARKIPKVWKPTSLDELREIVVAANEERRPIHPISTGHNWGLGSKLPVRDAELIDLSKLNKIIEVNEELCYARIQPGVTQKQLSDHLATHCPGLILNVTGSDAHSSILGNTLERGSGKNGHRADDLRELTTLLADGSSVSSGFGGMGSNAGCFYSYGLGPDLTHLFTQSNFGIVTEGVVNLMVKEPFTLFLAKIPNEKLRNFFGSFAGLVRKGIVGNSLELDSQNDPKIFELFSQQEAAREKSWIAWFTVYGEKELREVKVGMIKERLASVLSEIRTYDSQDKNLGVPIPVDVRLERYNGIPSDHSLIATAKSFGIELDETNPDIDLYKEMPGFRCVLPVIPFSTKAVDTLEFINEFSQERSLAPATSVIALDPYSLEVFCRVHFDRNDRAQIDKVEEWAKELLAALKGRGIFPYRLDINSMKDYLEPLSDPGILLKSSMKNLFDPNHIISPGRYII